MRRLFSIALLASTLFFLNQCVEDTIPEDPNSQNTLDAFIGRNGNLSTFSSLLNDNGIANTLAQSNVNFTVFAPSNQAFEAAGIDLNNINENDLQRILNYHIIPNNTNSALSTLQLSDGLLETANFQSVVISVGEEISIDEVAIITPNLSADNGFVHIIDEVLIPVQQDIPNILMNNPQFSLFFTALGIIDNEPNSPDLTTTENSNNPTVFVPTNTAMEGLLSTLELTNIFEVDTTLLNDILRYHIAVNNRFFIGDFPETPLSTSLPGQSITANDSSFEVISNGNFNRSPLNPDLLNIQATNGIIHGIDEVLLPARNVFDIVQFNPQFSLFREAMNSTELQDTLTSSANFTLFLPPNQAVTAAPVNIFSIPIDSLANIVEYHIISATIFQSAFPDTLVTFDSLQIVVVDSTLIDLNNLTPNASLDTADISTGNGIVHIIDQLLLPF